ncbi:MAG: cell division protein FtsZ [Candidatus Dependentiae bacterium]|nr:cell division protein FtsZ [Candidatus Dependentiae bacterium]
MIELVENQYTTSDAAIARIKVIGIGGAGGNTINSMVHAGLEHVTFIAANTDGQALEFSEAGVKVQLGSKLTKGLGSGANPETGRRATEEDLEAIIDHIDDADIVFLTAGLGGGTGSGGAPVIARALRERNTLSIAVVTRPFEFEGKRRSQVADEAIAQLKKTVDTLIIIPNQKLLDLADSRLSLLNAFDLINGYMGQFVKSISDIITHPGHINVDFADVQAIMRNMGSAVMGTGRAAGENRATEATLKAITSPLLESQGVKGARSVLINITGNSELGLHEVSAAAKLIHEQADEEASIVLGSVIDETMGDDVAVTIIATGFEHESGQVAAARPPQQVAPRQNIYEAQPARAEQPQPQSRPSEQLPQDSLEIPAALRKLVQEQQNSQ